MGPSQAGSGAARCWRVGDEREQVVSGVGRPAGRQTTRPTTGVVAVSEVALGDLPSPPTCVGRDDRMIHRS
jgi:hypothetical protein